MSYLIGTVASRGTYPFIFYIYLYGRGFNAIDTIMTNVLTSAARWQRLLLGLAILALNYVIYIIHITPSVSGYEATIYAAYPSRFWISLIGIFIFSTLVLFLSAKDNSRYWRQATLLILMGYVLLGMQPVFRGYLLAGRGGSDLLAHIGFVNPVLANGHLLPSDFYPGLHLWLGTLELLGITTVVAISVLNTLLLVLYLLGAFLFTRIIAGLRMALFVQAASVPLVLVAYTFGSQPAILSFFLVPLILFLYKHAALSRRNRSSALLMIVISFLVIFHPITVIMLAIIMAVFYVTSMSLQAIERHRRPGANRIVPLVFLGVLFLSWYFSYEATFEKLRLQIIGFLLSSRSTSVGRNTNALSETARTTEQILWWMLNTWGPIFLFAAIGGVASLVFLWRFYRGQWRSYEIEMTAAFGAGLAFATVNLFVLNLVNEPIRLSRLMALISVFLTGFFLHYLILGSGLDWEQSRLRQLMAVLLMALVLFSIPVGVMNAYPPNVHLSRSEAEGTEWLLQRADFNDYELYTLGQSIKITYYHYNRTVESRYDEVFSEDPLIDQGQFPKHLGYPENKSVTTTFSDLPAYLTTKTYDMEYFDVYPKTQQKNQFSYYTKRDINRLQNDTAAAKIYGNGGYSTWIIKDTDLIGST